MNMIISSTITAAVKDLCMQANYELGQDVLDAFASAKNSDTFPLPCAVKSMTS